MFNPTQMMGMMQNPRQMANSMLRQNLQANPLFQRAMQMANGKSPEQLQQIAQNLCQQKGVDMNQAIQQFQAQFGGRW